LDPAVAGQQMSHEQLGEGRLGVKEVQHLGLAHPYDLALGHGLGGRQTQRLADQAALAEELARLQDPDHRLLALLGRDHDLDLALLDIEDRVRFSRLREDYLLAAQVGHGVSTIRVCEKHLGIESGFGFVGHDYPPLWPAGPNRSKAVRWLPARLADDRLRSDA